MIAGVFARPTPPATVHGRFCRWRAGVSGLGVFVWPAKLQWSWSRVVALTSLVGLVALSCYCLQLRAALVAQRATMSERAGVSAAVSAPIQLVTTRDRFTASLHLPFDLRVVPEAPCRRGALGCLPRVLEATLHVAQQAAIGAVLRTARRLVGAIVHPPPFWSPVTAIVAASMNQLLRAWCLATNASTLRHSL